MSLHPTPTRLELLDAVRRGDVFEGLTEQFEGHTWDTTDAEYGHEAVKVDARIRELEQAGWVALPDDPPVVWQLTELGEQILAAGGQ